MSTRRTALVGALERQTRVQVLRTVTNMQVIATRAGINMIDMQCLSLLTLDGPSTPSQIAATMAIGKGGAVTAMIDRLEKAGYLRRTRDPYDRRKVLVEVVLDGAPFRRLVGLFQPSAAAFTGVLADYTDEQLELLVDYFERSNEAFGVMLSEPADEK
ncbi:MAG TPA: MarR family transcriptional regulator [Pseudonocardiaceae bacterium]|jgi:DNA-binding MarR family transcriptional regulator